MLLTRERSSQYSDNMVCKLLLCTSSHPYQEGAKYCAQRVCLSVCLSARISQKPHIENLKNFLYMLTIAVARSSSDDNAIVMYFQFCGCCPVCPQSIRQYVLKVTHRGTASETKSTTILFSEKPLMDWSISLICLSTVMY